MIVVQVYINPPSLYTNVFVVYSYKRGGLLGIFCFTMLAMTDCIKIYTDLRSTMRQKLPLYRSICCFPYFSHSRLCQENNPL